MGRYAMTHVAESTHWYHKDGRPCYEVKSANGSMRPTTLRDAKKLDLVPSVTTILKCAAAPGLEYWKTQQAVLAALTLPKIDGEPEKDYLARILRDSKEQARKAADRGTEIHAAIQDYIETFNYFRVGEYRPHVEAAIEELSCLAVDNVWVPERAFAHADGFGGKVDIHCPKFRIVVDIKTKEFDKHNLPDGYDEQVMQLAAYGYGLGLENFQAANLFVSVSNPGLAYLHIWKPSQIARGLRRFKALLQFWKETNLEPA
jgi:hypothetical protein